MILTSWVTYPHVECILLPLSAICWHYQGVLLLSLYPLPPATDVLHTAFTLALPPFVMPVSFMLPRSIWLCADIAIISHPIFYFGFHLFCIYWLVFYTPQRILSQFGVKNFYAKGKFFKYVALECLQPIEENTDFNEPLCKLFLMKWKLEQMVTLKCPYITDSCFLCSYKQFQGKKGF